MISLIIPVYNEETLFTSGGITQLQQLDVQSLIDEILIIDGGSTDNTVAAAQALGLTVFASPTKGRAAQMNYGASLATGSVLYFLHADTLPPKAFTTFIAKAVQNGYKAGSFRLRFDYDHWFLKANSWFTRFNFNQFRFGDQSLFVCRKLFVACGGFKPELQIMEDQEIIYRIRKKGAFCVLPAYATTSSRKYLDHGIYKTQLIFFLIYLLYQAGLSQKRLVWLYKKLFTQHKL